MAFLRVLRMPAWRIAYALFLLVFTAGAAGGWMGTLWLVCFGCHTALLSLAAACLFLEGMRETALWLNGYEGFRQARLELDGAFD